MAIGSDGEIGVTFSRWGDMDQASRWAWYAFMRTQWGPDLHGGHAKLCYPVPERIQHHHETSWCDVLT